MNYRSVARILSLLMLILAGSAFGCAAIAAAVGETSQIISFSVTGLGVGVAASSVLLLTPRPGRGARPVDGLAVAVLWWSLAPFAAAMPFVFGVANSSVITAVHEAASCLTTTGHSLIAVQGGDWPVSLIVWRGLLHLIGAFGAIVMAAGVLAAINLGGPGIHRTVLFSLPETSFFDAMPRIVRPAGLMLSIGILFIFVLALIAGEAPARALSQAVSAITTGLVDPGAAMKAPSSVLMSLILGLGLVLGALGFALWLPLRGNSWATLMRDPEIVLFAVLAMLFALAAWLWGLGAGDAFGWSVSTLATSGLPLGDPQATASLPVTLYVLPCLVGGSALGAAGGIKLARVVVLALRAAQEFRQLGYRRSLATFRFRDRILDERSVMGVWVYFVAYVLAVFLFVVAFSFAGIGFEPGIRLAIGGLTSSGALVQTAAAELSMAAEAFLIFAMLLGRLEILALLPALSPSFWRS